MRKEIEFIIDYYDFDEQVEKKKLFVIRKVPNRVFSDYTKIFKTMSDIVEKEERRMVLISDQGSYITDKSLTIEQRREKVKELDKEIAEIDKFRTSIEHIDYFKERYFLIRKLLVVNGIKDDMFLSIDFWDNNVDTDTLTAFLHMVVYKDLDSLKKKALKATKLITTS